MAKEAATSTDFMNSLQTKTMCNGLLDELVFCTICIDDIKLQDTSSQLPCSHIFHLKCILEALYYTNMCPNCRCEFTKPVAEYELDIVHYLMMETLVQMFIESVRNLLHAHRSEHETLDHCLLADPPRRQEIMLTTSQLDNDDDVMETTAHTSTGRTRKLPHAHRSARKRLANGLLSRTGNRNYSQSRSHISRRGFNRSR